MVLSEPEDAQAVAARNVGFEGLSMQCLAHTWAELALAICSQRLSLPVVRYLGGTIHYYIPCSNCVVDHNVL